MSSRIESISSSSSAVQSPLVRYIAAAWELGKPKVLSLLLISTACPMVLASGGTVKLEMIIWALIGGSLVSASASVINCIWDMDIDIIMKRTRNRPLPEGRVSPTFAAVYSLLLGFSGILVLALMLNPLAAYLALLGHVFYVFIYTMWLKRSTPQNIVIGGAAGAVPPLVGWAAVTNSIELQPLLMFLLVFLWTPPHFWALALNKNEDYKRAGIPMFPVIFGERLTHKQMLAYALALIPTGTLLVLSDSHLGWFSMISFNALSVYFAYLTYRLMKLGHALPSVELEEQKTKLAWRIFGVSIVYLAVLFFAMVIDTLFV